MPKLRKLRFRILLAVANILLAFVLLSVGRAQMLHHVSQATVGGAIPLPLSAAYERARFVSYAMNVPAWLSASYIRPFLHIKGSPFWGGDDPVLLGIEDERDCWYLVCVGVLWLYIGYRLDVRGANRTQSALKAYSAIGAFTLVGLMLIRTGLYARDPSQDYEQWFVLAILTWGVGLIVCGLYALVRRVARPID